MRYHLSDGLCINWEKRKRPQKHLKFLNCINCLNLIACCLSFYSSAFHTNRDAFDMHVSNFCDHLLVQKEVGDCRYHAKKNPKHSNKECAVLLETDLYVSCKLIYLHEYRQK